MIDIAVPRNVEPEVAKVEGVVLYDIDALTGVCERNRKEREADITRAQEIVAAEVEKFAVWWRDLESRPTVRALMSKAEQIRARQLQQTLKRLPPLSQEQRESLEAMTKSIVTNILKDPVHHLKAGGNGNGSKLVRELFHLDDAECQTEPD